MAKLTEAKKREIEKASTEQEKVKAAAVMIDTPMDLIRRILQRHEESVIEVMRGQRQEIERLREGLKLIACEPINAEYMAQNILDGKPPGRCRVQHRAYVRLPVRAKPCHLQNPLWV